MATVKSTNYTNYEARSAFAQKYEWNGRVKSMTDYITTLASGNTNGDLYYFGRLPANAHVIGYAFSTDAAAGSLTIKVDNTAISGALATSSGGVNLQGPVINGAVVQTAASGSDVTGQVATTAFTANKTVRVTVFYVENT